MSDGTSTNVEGFLLQFDGSCRRDEHVGGAGYCIFRIKPGELVFVEGGSVALGTCSDNVEAEAEAVVSGFTRLLDTVLLMRPPEQPRLGTRPFMCKEIFSRSSVSLPIMDGFEG